MSEHNYDVIIIGGNPAGLFAGIACARNELRTLVLEKQTYLIDKACGEGIIPSGVFYLRKLGVTLFWKSFFLVNLILLRHRIRLEKLTLDEI